MSEVRPQSGGMVLRCQGLAKTFREGPAAVPVLRGVDLEVGAGEMLAIIGASASGMRRMSSGMATFSSAVNSASR